MTDPPFTQKEFLELAKLHRKVAETGMKIGPNIGYVRTFQACALALEIAASQIERSLQE